jgi:transcriptional regulator with XRE-family HTH domain
MDHTDLGRMINGLIGEADISQGKLAKDLGISPSMLSNYLSGKNIPPMELIEKCRERFNLKNGKIKEIFAKTFLSSAQSNHMIHLDTRFFDPDKLDLLVKAILIIMLYPKSVNFDSELQGLQNSISRYYDALDYTVDFRPFIRENDPKSDT